MAWYLDSTRVFVQEHEESDSQIMPRLQPLAGGTVIQLFGYESKIVKVMAIIVGETDRNALRAMAKSGSTHTLTFPDTSTSDFYVKSVGFKQIYNICQTLRPDLAEDASVFNVSLELQQED